MDNLEIAFLAILFGPVVMLAFIASLAVIPKWIKKSKKLGLLWDDMHKKSSEKIPGSGGMAVLMGFVLSTFLYIGIKTFVLGTESNLVKIFGILMVIILASSVGLIDDLLGWKSGGLSKLSRIILMFLIAVPLMILNVGQTNILGIEFGVLYPLLLIPIGIVGATTTFNFLAGYNGLEASQGMILLTGLALVTYLTGNPWLSLISMSMVAALLAFFLFNKYPAKIFPGDLMTYPVGALIACIAILGNIEKIAIFFFIPYIIEVGLKSKGKLKKQSFGKLEKDGSLSIKEGIYGLEHVAIWFLKKVKGKAYEWEVPLLINGFQILVIAIGFILFF